MAEYPNVRGSSWFDNSFDGDGELSYDVPYYHLQGDSDGARRQIECTERKPSMQYSVLVPPVSKGIQCRQCQQFFTTQNQLHKHLLDTLHFSALALQAQGEEAVELPVMKPVEVNGSLGTGFAFRGYRYAEVRIRTRVDDEDQWVCADSGCGMTVVDEVWFREQFPGAHVASM